MSKKGLALVEATRDVVEHRAVFLVHDGRPQEIDRNRGRHVLAGLLLLLLLRRSVLLLRLGSEGLFFLSKVVLVGVDKVGHVGVKRWFL